ncbi:MAG: hypothetical protein ACYC3A_08490 [Halothiobacillus sp.]
MPFELAPCWLNCSRRLPNWDCASHQWIWARNTGRSKIILNLVFDALGFEEIIKPASGIFVVGWFGFSGGMTNFSAIFFSLIFFGPLFPWLIQISYFGVVAHCVKSSEFRRKFAALYRVFRHLNRGCV